MNKSKTVRTSISLPVDLRERMDKVAGQVNWSAIAGGAIRKALDDLDMGRDIDAADISIRREGSTIIVGLPGKVTVTFENVDGSDDAGKLQLSSNVEIQDKSRHIDLK